MRTKTMLNRRSSSQARVTNLLLLLLLSFSSTFVLSYDFTNIPSPVQQPFFHSPSSSSSSVFNNDTFHANSSSSKTQGYDGPIPTDETSSILFNVSSLGLDDPFANFSTRVTYDSKVEITSPHHNQKGSILTLLNGTIFPMGSVGSIGAIGWEGGFNETDSTTSSTSSPDKSNSSDSTTHQQGDSPHNETQTDTNNNKKGALSGIWLAFTSQDAITGGYTFNNESLTTSNNLIYQNVTFLSNFTIHHDGTYSFRFSLSTTPSSTSTNTPASSATEKEEATESRKFAPPKCQEVNDQEEETKFAMICRGLDR